MHFSQFIVNNLTGGSIWWHFTSAPVYAWVHGHQADDNWQADIKPLVPGRHGHKFKCLIFEPNLGTGILSIMCKTSLMWMPQDSFDDQSTMVQVMTWCLMAARHCLNQCWWRFRTLEQYLQGQWVKCSTFHKISTSFFLPVLLTSALSVCGYTWCIYPYPSGLLHWHWDIHMIAPVPVK